ncbi:MAG: endolytic transglycosylase MltG [Oscillospiraceae bacterium]
MQNKNRKKSIGKIIILSVLLVFVLVIAGLITFVKCDIDGKLRGADEVSVKIEEGMGPLAIGKLLKDNGVVRSAQLFRFYVKSKGEAGSLQYGNFDLTTDMSYDVIIEKLKAVKNNRASVRVTFPEGSTVIQFAKKMEAAGLCPAQDFIKCANEEDFSEFKFFSKIGNNPNVFMRAEGYLFPDTYDFYKDDTVHNMVAKLYKHFDEQITDEMYARMDELGMSLSEVITLATFVQEEAGHPENQADVAAALHNRLKKDSPLPRLECNVCSMIMEDGNYIHDYIIPYYGGAEFVPEGMLEAYNTYKLNGLPASPISCPGIDAIKNTLYPTENSPYYYFVTDLNGKYYFSVTLDEHNKNIAITKKVNASINK